MAGWGAFTADRDGKWNTDAVTTRVFSPMRWRRSPGVSPIILRCIQITTVDAVRFTTAVLESYAALSLPEQHLTPQDPWAYFTQPTSYKNLQCKDGSTQHSCQEYRSRRGLALAYNESLSMMKALAEAALAARQCSVPKVCRWHSLRFGTGHSRGAAADREGLHVL